MLSIPIFCFISGIFIYPVVLFLEGVGSIKEGGDGQSVAAALIVWIGAIASFVYIILEKDKAEREKREADNRSQLI
jgi:hypothetical protein